MKIGILGTGDVGQALGRGFVAQGHEVKMGSRDAANEKMAAWVAEVGEKASGGTFAEAAAFGEVLVLAHLWVATDDVLAAADKSNFSGKTVLDCTNPLKFVEGQGPTLAVGHTDSGGEQIQAALPDAKVVKVFNIVGNNYMVNPDFGAANPTMFICGNDGGAKKTVTGILESFGWKSIADIGGMEGARLLEPMCILWVKYGMTTGGWNHAFAMLTK